VGAGKGVLAARAAALGADTVAWSWRPSWSVGRRSAPVESVSGSARFVAIPAGSGAFDAGARQLRPFNHVGRRRRPGRGLGVCGRGGWWRTSSWDAPRRNRYSGWCWTPSRRAGGPDGGRASLPHHFPRTPSCGSVPRRGVHGRRLQTSCSRRRRRTPTPLWQGARSAVRSRRWSSGSARTFRRGPGGVRGVAAVHRRPDGSLAFPVAVQVTPGGAREPPRADNTGEPGGLRRGGRAAFLRRPGGSPPARTCRFEAVRDGEADAGVVPARDRCWARSARTRPAVRVRCPSGARWSCRCAWRCSRFPGSARHDRGVFSIAAALAKPTVPRSRPLRSLTTYNIAGAASRSPSWARGERPPRLGARRPIYGWPRSPTDPCRACTTGPVPVYARAGREAEVRAAAATAAVAGPPPDVAGVRGAQRPGSLHRSLGAFASRGINLSRPVSRPWTDRGAAGYTVLGRCGRRSRRPCADALADLATVASWSGFGQPTRGPPRTELGHCDGESPRDASPRDASLGVRPGLGVTPATRRRRSRGPAARPRTAAGRQAEARQ